MSLKLKVLGLGLLAMMATSAFGVMNASGEVGGHFTSDSTNTIITGKENFPTAHFQELTVPGLAGIVCEEAKYNATTTNKTVESITVTPTYGKCKTTNGTAGEVTVDVNGCTYTFTVNKSPETKHQTVHLLCPVGKSLIVTHPSCEITVAAQTPTGGVLYKTIIGANGKHAITLESTVTFNAQFHAGACVLLGTNKVSELKGSATVEGWEDVGGVEGAAVGITAT